MAHDLRIERLIDASPEVVFDAFVDPEAQGELYGDPSEPAWAVESRLDLRVGGTWTITFGRAGERRNEETNRFTEVDRPRRLAFESTMALAAGRSFDTTVAVTFEEQDGKTKLTIEQTGFEREADRDGIEEGWPGILDALERVVASA